VTAALSERHIQIDLDNLYELGDAVAAHRRIIQAAIDGGLSLDEAERLAGDGYKFIPATRTAVPIDYSCFWLVMQSRRTR
jgi:hypothetical protein